MPSCERCWSVAQSRGIGYEEQLRLAEHGKEPCTLGDENARRLQAGQFWDDERKLDRRSLPEGKV